MTARSRLLLARLVFSSRSCLVFSDIASSFADVASCFLESAVLVLLSVLARLFDFILFHQDSCFILFYLDAIRATQKQQPLSQFKAVASKDVVGASCL